MHFDISTRRRWMAALADATPEMLRTRMRTLGLPPEYEPVHLPQSALAQRLGVTHDRFLHGDTTLTRAVVKLASGTLGFGWVPGRDKGHAERCAVCDALLQEPNDFQMLMETLIAPLEADRAARIQARQAEANSRRVDFFTRVGGENA